ncbi:MAG: iron ABC transporter permease [Pseudomonadota bacterium]
MGRLSTDRIWTITAVLIAAFVSIPLVAVLWALPSDGGGTTDHLWRTTLPGYAANTAQLMLFVGAMTAFLGVGLAWLVTVASFPGRVLFSWLLVLPLAAPAYIIAYLYTDLLTFSGPVQTWLRGTFDWQAGDYWFPAIRSVPGAALMLSLVLYPYVYLLARAAFSAQSRGQFQAARTLGLSPGQAFLRVALPGARPAIVAGLALVLMETLADFGVADYFAIPTFSTGIFRTWLAMGDRVAAMKLAGVMLLIVFALVTVEALSRRGEVASGDRLSAAPPPLALSGIGSALAMLACLLPVMLGFIVPAAVLVHYAVVDGDGQSWTVIGGYAKNSVVAAVLASLVATGLAVLLTYAGRKAQQGPSPRKAGPLVVRSGIRLATLGYALPGALLAVGLLSPLGGVDQSLTRFSRDTFGFSHGLLLTGTIALLVYALVVRFLTVSYNSVSAGMEKVSPSMDAAARSLGASPWQLMTRVHIPLLRPSLAAGVCLVFIDVMRELPATLILRPFNFETLATRVYRLASDERLSEASTAALIIVIAGLIPVLLLNRFRR